MEAWRAGCSQGVVAGSLWSAKPEIVVHDTPGRLVLYLPAGTPWKKPISKDGTPLRLTPEDWILGGLPMAHRKSPTGAPGCIS
jgi:hypothetical protein